MVQADSEGLFCRHPLRWGSQESWIERFYVWMAPFPWGHPPAAGRAQTAFWA